MQIEMNNGQVRLHQGDSRDVLKTLEDASIDSIVCDPPYALVSIQKRFGKAGSAPAKHGADGAFARAARGFMGKDWDVADTAFAETFWAECLRVLKPGGHVVAFGGTRTYHRLVCAIEDAGFEIRDQLGWVYGSGFPKSHDVSKGIDKQAGAEREVVGTVRAGIARSARKGGEFVNAEAFEELKQSPVTVPATDLATQWQGWGTALKPAWEPICLARKPLIGTVVANVLEHGTGALNIDGCRVGHEVAGWGGGAAGGSTWNDGNMGLGKAGEARPVVGRWPANIIHDGSDEVLAAFPDAKGQAGKVADGQRTQANVYGATSDTGKKYEPRVESNTSAARFFQVCQSDDEDWLCQNLNLLPARTAEGYSLLSSEPAYTALVHAASEALPEGLCCESLSTQHFTSVTPKQLRSLAENFIEATQNIAARFLREWQQERLSQKDNPVNVVATRWPTGITQITVSHWTSSGSADPAIFSIMPKNLVAGGKACALFTAGRFLYNPKASRKDRDEGLDGFEAIHRVNGNKWTDQDYRVARGERPQNAESGPRKNIHPTVKPTSLMQYLCRLITPPGGTILDPFMGSGSTGKAAVLEGFNFVGIEREDEYMPIAKARIEWAVAEVANPTSQPTKTRPVVAKQPANDNGAADLFAATP